MDLPRPTLVKQLTLYLSPEGRSGLAYLLADHVSGNVLRLTRAAALSFSKFTRAALGDADARKLLSEEDARTGFMTLNMASQMRNVGQYGPKRFNPLSISLPMFDVGPWQIYLQSLARLVFGPFGFPLFLSLALAAFWMGLRNNWSAATAFQNSMTLEAFLTFGLFAPVLKLIHELGHVLAATKSNVRVRMGGVNFIAFFPIPYVDCSHADLVAQRGARMMISAAGVLTDFTIGLTAFCLWHLAESQNAKDLLGYIFVFSTLNSLLFNANPLMRMDGYFVLSDGIGRRNLGTDGATFQRNFLAYLRSFGANGGVPQSRADWLHLGYGLASSVYRVLLLIGLLWVALPQFFGIGIIAAIWAAWAMFGDKLLGLTTQPAQKQALTQGSGAQASENPASKPVRRWYQVPLGKWALMLAALVALLCIPISPRVVIDLHPDLTNNYNLTNTRAGRLLTDIAPHGYVTKGTILARLRSSDIADALDLAVLGVAEAQIVDAIAQGEGAAQIKAGADRVASALALQAFAQKEDQSLTIRAPASGYFRAATAFRKGMFLRQGTVIGAILPKDGPLALTGIFPEKYVIHFDHGITRVRLWDNDRYQSLDPATIQLVEEVGQDATNLTRGFTLRLVASSTHFNSYPQVRLAFSPIPIWRHATLWFNRKLTQFRDAQLSETERRIEN